MKNLFLLAGIVIGIVTIDGCVVDTSPLPPIQFHLVHVL